MLISVDDRATWPIKVLDFVAHRADELLGSAEHTNDLAIDPADDEAFADLFEGHRLAAFHCSRLLSHEIEAIRNHGLSTLSAELVAARIKSACEAGAFDARTRDALIQGSVYAAGGHEPRDGRLWLFLSEETFDTHYWALWRLFTIWGGEGIYWNQEGTELEPTLRSIGVPTIVKVGLDVATLPRGAVRHLLKPFVGRHLSLEHPDSEVCLTDCVPAEDVVDVLSPGHPEYDRHTHLPAE
jgi:hypothetical protein